MLGLKAHVPCVAIRITSNGGLGQKKVCNIKVNLCLVAKNAFIELGKEKSKMKSSDDPSTGCTESTTKLICKTCSEFVELQGHSIAGLHNVCSICGFCPDCDEGNV